MSIQKKIYKFLLQFTYAFFSLFPVKNKITLASNNADKLDRNLLFIYNEIKKQNLDVEVVTYFNKAKNPGAAEKVKAILKNMYAEYHIATSRIFIIDDYYFPLYVVKPKKETTVIQVWHASGAFKKIGYSVVDKEFGANEDMVKAVNIHSNYDYCLMGSKHNARFYSEAFKTPIEKFRTDIGIPRTDVFFDEELKEKTLNALKAQYSIPDEKKIILYAPTFRGESRFKSYYKDDLDFKELKKYIGDEYILLLKLHPFIAKKYEIADDLKGFLFNVTNYPDINELMLISDLLITDYSSAIFEYAILDKPMMFYATDYYDYLDERGFYIDFHNDLPGKVYTDTKSMASDIKNKKFEIKKLKEFKAKTFEVADGCSSERFVNELIKPFIAPHIKNK